MAKISVIYEAQYSEKKKLQKERATVICVRILLSMWLNIFLHNAYYETQQSRQRKKPKLLVELLPQDRELTQDWETSEF